MAPVIDKDYQGSQWLEQLMAQWVQTYGNTDLSTNRQAWNALGQILKQAFPKEQEIVQGYEAVIPPDAFRAAHTSLLENNREGTAQMEKLFAAIEANHPIEELTSMVTSSPPGPSNSEVLVKFQDAAAQVGVEVPAELVGAYSDDTDSGTAM